jgi:hypothetical protein
MKTRYLAIVLIASAFLFLAVSGAYAWTMDCAVSPTKDVGFNMGRQANSNGDIDRCGLVILRFKFMQDSPSEVEFMKPDFHKVVDKSANERGRELEIDRGKK